MEAFADGLLRWLAMILPFIGGIAVLWKKLDKIRDCISRIDKKKVSHKTCEKRRAACPCKTTSRKD